MPSYITFGLFVATLVLPLLVALAVAIYGNQYSRYFFGLLGITVAIGLNAGIAYYSSLHYPEWWSSADWPLGAIYVPALIVNVVGTLGALSLAERVDHSRRTQPYGSNVRRFRRSA